MKGAMSVSRLSEIRQNQSAPHDVVGLPGDAEWARSLLSAAAREAMTIDKNAQSSVTVTPAAEAFMRRIVRFGGMGERAGFRLTVSPGGCSGLSSRFTVEAQPTAGDEVVSVNGLDLYLPPESSKLLAGVTIDFLDTRTESGFAFIDPNAEGCACSSGATTGVQLGSFKN